MTLVDNSVTTGTFTSGTVTLYGASSNDRVVINSDGMAIYTANVLKASAYDAGFTAYGDNATTYTTMGSGGLTVVDNSNTKATFADAGATVYGDNSTTYTTMNSSGLTIVDNSVTTGTFTSGTVTLYGASSNDRVVINASGMAVYTANVLKASAYDAGFTAYGDNLTTYTSMTSGGITIVDDSVTTGTFTAGTVTLYGASSNDRVVINSDGMAIYTANVLKASAYDAGFTAYGDNATTYTTMNSSGLTIVDNSFTQGTFSGGVVTLYGDNATTYTQINSSGMTMVDNSVTTGTFTAGTVTLYGASSNDRVVINADGMAIYTANVLKATAYDAGFTAYGDNLTTYTTMNSSGLTIVDNSVTQGTFTGGTVTLYGGSAADKVTINSSGMTVTEGSVDVASFGATTTVGITANHEYVNIDTAGVKVYGGDADSYTHMDGTSFKVYENAAQKAQFGGETWIGDSSSTKRVQISGSGVHLYNDDNEKMVSMNSVDGTLEATRLKIEQVAQADYFNYRNIVVGGASGERANYYMQYTSSNEDTTIYTALILDGSQGGPAGMMIRFDDAPLYPLGVIVAPGYKGGHTVTFEGVQDVYIARAHNISGEALRNQARSQGLNPMFSDASPPVTSTWGGGGSNYGFYSDSDDIIGGATNGVAGDSFYSHAWTAGDSVAHTNLGKITSGTRLQFTKSSFDFRVTGFNGTPDFAPNFQGGICAPGGVTAGDDAQQNATYKNFTVGSVGATVNVVAYASDERLKENIVPFVSGSDYLDKIRPVEFDWNEKAYEMGFKPDQHHEFGFIAQELGEVLPQSIAPAPINKKDDDYLTIKEEKLIPILVSSLKEQRNEIADLKEDIKDLKKIVKEL
jgi:hypothetical protein